MYHLAQINIGKLTHPVDHPIIADFANNLDRINQLADTSPGFIWRLQDESGDATGFNPFGNSLIIVNMSVWESVADLKQFVYQSGHMEIFKRRDEWFEKLNSAQMALWWVAKGHIPSIDEAKEKLAQLDKIGESETAFTFRKLYDPPAR